MADCKLDGFWRAKVMRNDDEENRERILVRVLGVHDISDNFSDKEMGVWCEKMSNSKNGGGGRPEVGTFVWMCFQHDENGTYTPFEGIWTGFVITSE